MYRPGSGHLATSAHRSEESTSSRSRSFRLDGDHHRSPSPWSRRHRLPPSGRSSRCPGRSPSPHRNSRRYSMDQSSHSPRRCSYSPGWCSESSVEKYFRVAVADDQYGYGRPERKMFSDRIGSPAGSLSDVERDDLTDGPVFSRGFSHPWNLEKGFSHEENPSSPFSTRHNEDYCSRDRFISQLDCSINYEHLQAQSRDNDRDGEQEANCFLNDRDDRLLDVSIKSQDFLSEPRKYFKQSLNRSQSLMYLDEDFCKPERMRTKREEDVLSRNISTGYPMLDSANLEQSSEPRYHYRVDKIPAMPKKSILKKRVDDPSVQNSGSFLKEREPHESTSESINQHGDFLLLHEIASQDGSGFSHILGMMTDSTSTQEKRKHSFPDNIDEDKFLYGDNIGDLNKCPSFQKLILSEEKEFAREKVSPPSPSSPSVKPDTSEEFRPEYETIHDLLKTIGLDIGMAEINKLAARTQERLHGKKTTPSTDHHSVANLKPESSERHCSLNDIHSPEAGKKHSLSPSGSFPSSEVVSSVLKSDHNKINTLEQNNPTVISEQSGAPGFLIPSAPPPFPDIPPVSTSVPWPGVSHFSPFAEAQLASNSAAPTVVPSGYDAYQHYMANATSGWYAQKIDTVFSNRPERKSIQSNLKVIQTDSISKVTCNANKDEIVSTTTLYSQLLPQLSQPSLKDSKERISDDRNRASQKQKVIEETEKLKLERQVLQKKLYYQRIELNRLSKQQVGMLRKKRKEEDPLLVELSHLKERIEKAVAQLELNFKSVKKKQSELDKVAHILGMNVVEKSRKLSSENKDSSENNK